METEWSLVIVILFSPGRVFLCAFLVHATFPSFYRSWIYTENGTSSHLSLSPSLFLSFPLLFSSHRGSLPRKSLNVFTSLRGSNQAGEGIFSREILISEIACQVSRRFVNFERNFRSIERKRKREKDLESIRWILFSFDYYRVDVKK